MDIVTVFHNATNHKQTEDLFSKIRSIDFGKHRLIGIDNREENRGFSKACNLGAREGSSSLIGFINPDVEIDGPFSHLVSDIFVADPFTVITGESFGKDGKTIYGWGLRRWVCGAAFFVRRSFFESVGGFDDRFVWSWEETDLCRQAEQAGKRVEPIRLPLRHPLHDDNSRDFLYKRHWFFEGFRLYKEKWGMS